MVKWNTVEHYLEERGLNASGEFLEAFEDTVTEQLEEAVQHARADGRETLYDQDI